MHFAIVTFIFYVLSNNVIGDMIEIMLDSDREGLSGALCEL